MFAEEVAGRVHLEWGGVGAGEEHRLFRSFGKVAAFGLFDGAELGCDVGNQLLGQRLVAERVGCAANAVCCFLMLIVITRPHFTICWPCWYRLARRGSTRYTTSPAPSEAKRFPSASQELCGRFVSVRCGRGKWSRHLGCE